MTHTIAAKPVLLKTHALAKRDRLAARAQAAREQEYVSQLVQPLNENNFNDITLAFPASPFPHTTPGSGHP